MLNFIIQYWAQFAFGLLISAVGYLITTVKQMYLSTKQMYASTNERLDKLSVGMQKEMKSSLEKDISKWLNAGYITINALEIVVDKYNAYKDLGGNGVIDKLFQQLLTLEVKEKKER